MSDEEEEKELCGADCSTKDGTCQNPASYPDGLCGTHSEHTGKPGPPKGSSNNPKGKPAKHGVYSQPSMYYERLPDMEKAFVDSMWKSFLDDAPFGPEDDGKVEMLRQVAIDIHKRRQANDYIATEGLKWEEINDYYETDDGDLKVITETDEHYLNITADRLARTNISVLKNLGILDDPQSQQVAAQNTFLEMLSSQVDGGE